MDWEIIWAFEDATPWFLAMSLIPVGMFLFGLVFRVLWRSLAKGKLLRSFGNRFIFVWLAFVFLFGAFFIPMTISDYMELRSRYGRADFVVVEGVIEDFNAADTVSGLRSTGMRNESSFDDRVPERFSVEGQEFSYHPQTFRCHCFNNAGRDADLQNGDHVRIAHIDGHILRIERRR